MPSYVQVISCICVSSYVNMDGNIRKHTFEHVHPGKIQIRGGF